MFDKYGYGLGFVKKGDCFLYYDFLVEEIIFGVGWRVVYIVNFYFVLVFFF